MKGYPSIKRGEAGTLNVPATVETPTAYQYAITIRSGMFYKTLTATYADGKISATLTQADSLKLSETEPAQLQGRVIDSTGAPTLTDIYGMDVEHSIIDRSDSVTYTE